MTPRLLVLLVGGALALPAAAPSARADWKDRVAKEAIGRVAREGIEDAVKDVAMDEIVERATGGRVDGDLLRKPPDYRKSGAVAGAAIGLAAGGGIGDAVEGAGLGATLGAVGNAADRASRANKIRKAIKGK